jgi:hypothetical protein
VKLSLCLNEDVRRSGRINPSFLDLGTSFRWVVSFTPLPLYPRGNSPPYPLGRRLGGPQSRSGRHGGLKTLASTGIRTPTPWLSRALAPLKSKLKKPANNETNSMRASRGRGGLLTIAVLLSGLRETHRGDAFAFQLQRSLQLKKGDVVREIVGAEAAGHHPNHVHSLFTTWSTDVQVKCQLVSILHQLSTKLYRRKGTWIYTSTHSWPSALVGFEWSASHPSRFTLWWNTELAIV